MTVAEAGRRGIAGSIRKYGIEGHLERCSKAGRARLTKMTRKRRQEIAALAVAAREKRRMEGMSPFDLEEYLRRFPERAALLNGHG